MDYWSWENHVDDATITAISGGKLVASNLADPRLGIVWRSGAASGGTVQAEFRQGRPVSAIGVFGGNLVAMDSVTVRLSASSTGGEIYDQTFSPPPGNQIAVVFRDAAGLPAPGAEARYLTVIATGPAPLELGRLWAGPVNWHAKVGHTIAESNWQVIDLSIRSVTPRNGAFLIDVADQRRTFTTGYDALDVAEYSGAVRALDSGPGLHGQVLFIPEPAIYDQTWPILGYLRELPENRFLGFQRGGRVTTIVEAG